MSTHDYVIANASGSAVRADINNVLAAIVSNNSSSSEPSTKYAYMLWADTTNGILKIRNSANDAWIQLLQLDGTLTMEDGAEATPGLAFRDDLNTGIWSSAADTFNISTGGTERLELGAATVFNESGADVDFRIEGDSNANLFYVDAGNDRIGIGTSSPNQLLSLKAADPRILITETTNDSNCFFDYSTAGSLEISVDDNNVDSNSKFQVRIDGAAAGLTLDSSNLTITGDLVLANTKGINFSATADGSGASNVSELLDDYEVGSFLPTLSSGTSDTPSYGSPRVGGYVKIGRKVYFQFYVVITGGTGNGNHLKFGGLPFSSNNSATYGYGGGFVTYQLSMFDKGEDISFHIGTNDTQIKAYDSAGDTVNGNSSVVNDLTTHIALSGFYFAA